ncbi:MAG: hypothetical protein WC486_00165 [Candidatus Omnitrophota bacterium]
MIQAIGIMIGFYILTRMLQISGKKDTVTSAKIFAAITAIVTIICLFVIVFSGAGPSLY